MDEIRDSLGNVRKNFIFYLGNIHIEKQSRNEEPETENLNHFTTTDEYALIQFH
jgi:hypothetical protein